MNCQLADVQIAFGLKVDRAKKLERGAWGSGEMGLGGIKRNTQKKGEEETGRC